MMFSKRRTSPIFNNHNIAIVRPMPGTLISSFMLSLYFSLFINVLSFRSTSNNSRRKNFTCSKINNKVSFNTIYFCASCSIQFRKFRLQRAFPNCLGVSIPWYLSKLLSRFLLLVRSLVSLQLNRTNS